MVTITEFVGYILAALADDAEAIQVSATQDAARITVEVCAAEEEIGRLIGREGRTINAVRSLARVLGAKHGVRVTVNIAEPGAADEHTP